MKRIFKYTLTHAAEINIVSGPIIKPLTVDIQRGIPCLWAVVDTSLPDTSYEVICAGTGCQMPDVPLDTYLNTTICEDGYIVLHWFCRALKEGAEA